MNPTTATLKEIALVAGCSARVAAAVLNPGNSNIRVGYATQQRVLSTAREMGYRTNELARAMATGKSRVLGVVTSTQTEHGSWMLTGIIEAANEGGYTIKLLSFPHGVLPVHVIEQCIEWRLAALVLLPLEVEPQTYLREKAREFNIPLAIVDSVPSGFEGICASSDDEQGIFQVLDHLVSQGHRHIGFLGGHAQSPSLEREIAFRKALAQYRLPLREDWILQSHWYHIPTIEAAVRSLLSGGAPTAIVCAGDPLAMMVIRVARAAGLKVPDQLSVTGFANFYLSDFVDPPLTTVEQYFPKMGHAAASQLIAQLEGEQLKPSAEARHQKIGTRLIIRGSTAPPVRV